jgi:hypothetical protein
MPDPHDALARFRAATDAAVEQGRRVVGEAREAGAAFDRQTRGLVERLRETGQPAGRELTSPDLRVAARNFRTGTGLLVPDLPVPEAQASRGRPGAPHQPVEPDDEDFSQKRIMHKL